MNDLISRQDAINAIADYLSKTTYTSSISHLNTGALILARVPSIDAVPVKHGRWVEIQDDVFASTYKCSECGRWPFTEDGRWALTDYCPNCGARMDGDV